MSGILNWFANPGWAAIANWLVAAGALAVSIIALAVSIRTQRKQGSLQSRLVEIEEARELSRQQQARKAMLRAEIIRTEHRSISQFRLQISNDGEAPAFKVMAWLEDDPLMEHRAIPGNQHEITEIGRRSSVSYLLSITFGLHPPWRFRLAWQDESGTPGEYETTLTI